jgi:hypothetical protein
VDDGRVLVGLMAVALAVPLVVGALVPGAADSAGSRADEPMLKFPRGTVPAVARSGILVGTGRTADEALARLGFLAFSVAKERGLDDDAARREAWAILEPLVDRHRDELDDQGDAVSAMLDQMTA